MDIKFSPNAQPLPSSVDRLNPAAKPADVPRAAAATAAAPEPLEDEANQGVQVEDAVKNINAALNVRLQSLEFRVDEDSKRTIVSVVDKETKEVIRQMPSREALEIAKALDQLQSLLKKQTA